jgi:hypothetical protein
MLAFAAELDRRPNRIGTAKSACRKRSLCLASILGGLLVIVEVVNCGTARGSFSEGYLVHKNLQMGSFCVNERTLRDSKQMKRGVYEQGRENSKPHPRNVQNQDEVISIKESRVLPISISASETQSHDSHWRAESRETIATAAITSAQSREEASRRFHLRRARGARRDT